MKIKCYFAACDVKHDTEKNITTATLINVHGVGSPPLWVCEKHAKEIGHEEPDNHIRGYN